MGACSKRFFRLKLGLTRQEFYALTLTFARLSAAREAVNSHSQSQHAEIAQREKIVAARSTAETVLASARATAQTKKQTADERHIRLTSGEKQVALLSQTLQANQKQLTQLNDRRRLLAMQLADADAPLTEWSEALQVALTQRVTIENELRLIDARVQQEIRPGIRALLPGAELHRLAFTPEDKTGG